MRESLFPRIHGPDYDLCIRSINYRFSFYQRSLKQISTLSKSVVYVRTSFGIHHILEFNVALSLTLHQLDNTICF